MSVMFTRALRAFISVMLSAGPSIAWSKAPFDVEACRKAARDLSPQNTANKVLSKLEGKDRRLVEEYILPVMGQRAFRSGETTYRPWSRRENGITLSGFGPNKDVRVTWIDHAAEPYFHIHRNGNRTIFIPRNYDFSVLPDRGQGFFVRALRGHTLNVYGGSKEAQAERHALKEDRQIPKKVQEQGAAAFRNAMADGDDSYLYVGPTGVGKTMVMRAALEDRLAVGQTQIDRNAAGNTQEIAPGVHVVFANKSHLVKQLYDDLDGMNSPKGYSRFRWGSKAETEGTPMTIDALAAHARETGKPVVLVTTIQTLIARTGDPRDPIGANNIKTLQDHVASFTLDEAHNAGAPETINLLQRVRRTGPFEKKEEQAPKHRAKMIGFTATPTRQDMKFIDEMFHGNAFWAYRDSPEGYRTKRGQAVRPISEVLDQLEQAIDAGEAHPFRTWFLDPDKFETVSGEPLHIPMDNDPTNYRLNPKHYDNYIEGIRPILENNDHLFFACSNIKEAEALAKFVAEKNLKRPGGEHRIAVLHSDMRHEDGRKYTDAEVEKVKQDFLGGKITALFTVGMMNEGVNVPTLTAYIDTNRDTNPKDLIQRIGRVTRLTEDKIKRSDVVSFQRLKDKETADALVQLDNIGTRSWGEKGRKKKPAPEGEEDAALRRHDEEEIEEDDLGLPMLELPEDFATKVAWTHDELLKARNKFFNKEEKSKQADNIYEQITRHLRTTGSVDAFSRPVKSEIKAQDLLTEMLDSNGVVGRVFMSRVAAGDPIIREKVQAFRDERDARLAKMATPKGTIEVINDFASHYGRLPGVHRSTDEAAIMQAAEKHKNDPYFLLATERAAPELNMALKTDDAYLAKLSTPEGILETLVAFEKFRNRTSPSTEVRGRESMLAYALERLVDPTKSGLDDATFEHLLETHLAKHEALMFDLLAKREARNTRQSPKPAEERTAVAPSDKPQTKLDEMSQVLRNIDRPSLGLPPPQREIVVRIRGHQEGSGLLLNFYTGLVNKMGMKLKVRKVADQHLDLTIDQGDAPFPPSDLFAFENGVHALEHRTDGGKSFTNQIRVEVVGVGEAPRITDAPIRKYPLLTSDPKLSDRRIRGNGPRIGKDFNNAFGEIYLQLLKR